MTPNFQRDDVRDEKVRQAEKTLRLLAQLPVPEELADRVHARVRRRLAEERAMRERRGFWAFWFQNSPQVRRLQFAGAAALAIVVGSGCGVYYVYSGQTKEGNAVVAPVKSAPKVSTPDQSGSGGLSTAGAVRVPPTLKPIKVPPAPKKKPSASHVKPVPNGNAVPAPAAQSGTAVAPRQ